MTKERIIGLDLLRALAVLAVILSHTAGFLMPLQVLPIGRWIVAGIWLSGPLGQLGVELFFVLSGFLIGGILIRTYMSGDFSFTDLRRFLVRRWWRTIPNYWLILTIDILLYKIMGFGGFEAYKFGYFFFLQNLFTPHPPYFFGEAWSLSVEEWFYLSWPLCIYIVHRIVKPQPAQKGRFLLQVCLCYLSVFVLLRILNACYPAFGDDQDAGIRKVVCFRLDTFLYGVFWAWLSYSNKEVVHRWRTVMGYCGIILIVLLYWLIRNQNIVTATDPAIRFCSDAFLYLAIPLSFSLLLPWAAEVRHLPGRWFSRLIVYISKISYSLYLVHYSLVFIPFFSFLKITDPVQVSLWYVSYWIIVLVLASLLYRFFEYPVLQLRERYTRP